MVFASPDDFGNESSLLRQRPLVLQDLCSPHTKIDYLREGKFVDFQCFSPSQSAAHFRVHGVFSFPALLSTEKTRHWPRNSPTTVPICTDVRWSATLSWPSGIRYLRLRFSAFTDKCYMFPGAILLDKLALLHQKVKTLADSQCASD